MAKKKTSFVMRAGRDRRYTNEVHLSFLNGRNVFSPYFYFCYGSWHRKTKIAIEPGKSQKVRFTVEKED